MSNAEWIANAFILISIAAVFAWIATLPREKNYGYYDPNYPKGECRRCGWGECGDDENLCGGCGPIGW